jgi:hydrocephalus-inducing protein
MLTVFKIAPNRLELYAGQSAEIVISGYVNKPQLIEETFACYSIIGKTSGKDKIMKFKITSDFVPPLVAFSNKTITFRCEHHVSKKEQEKKKRIR